MVSFEAALTPALNKSRVWLVNCQTSTLRPCREEIRQGFHVISFKCVYVVGVVYRALVMILYIKTG